MIPLLLAGEWRGRVIAGAGFLLVCVQWWVIPRLPAELTEKWLWSLDPARGFRGWVADVFPIVVLLFPWKPFLDWADRMVRAVLVQPGRLALLVGAGGCVFWVFRVKSLALGDAQLIMDHFVALTTYASVREPLESVLHTDFSRLLFDGFGVHPRDSFQLLSCLWGIAALWALGRGIAGGGRVHEGNGILFIFLFLIGPVHLFFGYIEWYTQMAVGLLIFEVYAVRSILRQGGLWIALGGLVLACSSHLVSFGFLPAALMLIFATTAPERRWRTVAGLGAALAGALAATFFWISRHIDFDHSAKATTRLFATLLPLMREDNPDNPPGSWHYAWLSPNHLADLANEILLCALFPGLVILVCLNRRMVRAFLDGLRAMPGWVRGDSPAAEEARVHRAIAGLLIPQWALGIGFLLIWNPWLGFPGDWDLFSFFAWPALTTAGWMFLARGADPERMRALACCVPPAFSVVFAWVVGYSGVGLPDSAEFQARITGSLPEYHEGKTRRAIDRGLWPIAIEHAEGLMRSDPSRAVEAADLLGVSVIQRMAEEWPGEEKLTRMAVDFEIVSATPERRLFVLDRWGRVFLWEGGYYNAWSYVPVPGVPDRSAVDLEIVPWRQCAVILCDDGTLFEVPAPSFVNPYPESPGETVRWEPPLDRSPRPAGNFYEDYAGVKKHPGSRAVDLELDWDHQAYVILDQSGNVVSSRSGVDFQITARSSFVGIDLEVNRSGDAAWVGTYFGHLKAWPGEEPPVPVAMNFNWPAVVDFEIPVSGRDVYVMEILGGIHTFSGDAVPFIETPKMTHYSPTGEVEAYFPYAVHPLRFFSDLELVPGEKAFYRMGWNFRIHRSDQPLEGE